MKTKLLIIGCESFPYPPSFNGVTENVFHILKYLHRQADMSVDFLYLKNVGEIVSDENIAELKKACNHVFLMEKKTNHRYRQIFGYFLNQAFRNLVRQYDQLFYSSYSSMFNVAWGLRKRSILYIADSMSHYTLKTPHDYSPKKFSRHLREEKFFFRFFSEVIVVSNNDRNHLQKYCPGHKILRFPIGIDLEKVQNKSGTKIFDIIFTGNLDYPPNREAALFLAKQLAPKLLLKQPKLKIVLAGRNPGMLTDYASENLLITGEVENIPDYIEASRVYVAPVFSGSGMKNKVLQAIAAGLPVIGTSEAFSGFDNRPENLFAEVADELQKDTDCWTAMILNTLAQLPESQQMKDRCLSFLKTTYSWAHIIPAFYVPLITQKRHATP